MLITLKGSLSVQLFDKKVRTDQDFIKPNESTYTFLNRSARAEHEATRQLLEAWFLDHPTNPESLLHHFWIYIRR